MERNVVLIILDSVRKDFFDEYAPRLQQLADISLPECRAASSWSAPSHASMFSGILPHQHGIHAKNPRWRLDRSETFVSEFDRAVGASANVYAGSAYGFDTIFDEFSGIHTEGAVFPGGLDMSEYFTKNDNSGLTLYTNYIRESIQEGCFIGSMTNLAVGAVNRLSRGRPFPRITDYGASVMMRDLLSKTDGPEPFFMFLNVMDAHGPFEPVLQFDSSLHSVPVSWSSKTATFDMWDLNITQKPDRYDEALRNIRHLYAAAIDYLDRRIVSFIETIDRRTMAPTTFIVTADHGQLLGQESDEYLFGHETGLHEALLHVPFLLINSPIEFEPDEIFTHLDLPDLVAAIVNDQQPPEVRDRVPAERIGLNNVPDVGASEWNCLTRCVYSDGRKYVWDSTGDTQEVRAVGPGLEQEIGPVTIPKKAVEEFDIEIEEYLGGLSKSEDEIDEATRMRLKELGYI